MLPTDFYTVIFFLPKDCLCCSNQCQLKFKTNTTNSEGVSIIHTISIKIPHFGNLSITYNIWDIPVKGIVK